jgi:hypothetical protein
MAALRDLLEVYGALDEAAASDPAVAASLDKFLPGSSANTGWYRQVEQFFFGKDARTSPDLYDAYSRIAETSAEDAGKLTVPQQSRLFYGLSAAAYVQQTTRTPALPSFTDPKFREKLAQCMVTVAPSGQDGVTLESVSNAVPQFLDDVLTYPGRSQHDALRSVSARNNIIDPAMLDISLCKSAVLVVNGVQSVVVDTRASSTAISLNNVKKIVNPFNWDENYSDFFLKMEQFDNPVRPDGWRRVRETVGFAGFPQSAITTGLKYFPVEDTEGGAARIDYDLDDPAPAPRCDGKVIVDKGYINMWVDNETGDPDEPGVRVRTRKVVHITGLSPFAQQRLVCLTGYGTASNEFLFGPAVKPRPEARTFTYYDDDNPPSAQDEPDGPETSTHVVATAVDMWTDSLQSMTSGYFDLAQKWVSGGLTINDVTDYGQQVTGHVLNAPLKFLEKVNQPRYPGGGSGDRQKRGG